jgi:drug/metabolite transporter (DMT)-like permease
MMHDLFELLGIKGPVVAAGLAGGVLRALSRHRYKLREMVASPICGALAAAYLTLPAVSYFKATGLPLPEPSDDTTTLAAAFLIGVCAMWISDILFEFVVRKLNPTLGDDD